MSATDNAKEAYVQLEAGYKYGDERTITHLLLEYHPRFLELDARWVDALIEAEGDMKDTYGNCNLMFLFMSTNSMTSISVAEGSKSYYRGRGIG